ncbi:hypothetical protein TNCV_643101 [Trichonephila clavipes]|nr:hypothetical protein TNCV_643101 [Trichonephila clavipes]
MISSSYSSAPHSFRNTALHIFLICPTSQYSTVIDVLRLIETLSPYVKVVPFNPLKSVNVKAKFTPKLSASSVERLASQRLHLGRDKVSDWLDAQRSTLTALV